MNNFSIFVIKQEEIQKLKRKAIRDFHNKGGERYPDYYQIDGLWNDSPSYVRGSKTKLIILEPDSFSQDDLPFKQISFNNETIVRDLIKQIIDYPQNNFYPFPLFSGYEPHTSFSEYDRYNEYDPAYYKIKYTYILGRCLYYDVSNFDYNVSNLEKYYQTKIFDLGFLDGEVAILTKITVEKKINTDSHFIPSMRPESVFSTPKYAAFKSILTSELSSINRDGFNIVFLYTDADEEFAKFVRKSISEIHKISGLNINIYVIEKFITSENTSEVIEYWRNLLSEQLYCIYAVFGMIRSKPYDKLAIYDIAKELKIEITQIPCIAFFDKFKDYLYVETFKTEHLNINFIRRLFQDLEQIFNEALNSSSSPHKKFKERLLELFKEKLPELRKNWFETLNNPKDINQQQKILILAAIPHGLRLDKEIREIEEAIRRATNRDLFEIKVRTAVRPADIRHAIAEEQPSIVHFCGHGLEDGSLLLEDDGGNDKPVTPSSLASLFKLHADYVKCVLLNPCYSEKPAVAISQYINYVIGMNNSIQDGAAIEFAKGFYDGVGYKTSNNQDVFQRAFDEGMVAIEMENVSQGAIPVLKKNFK
ncbi:CHAT domain-containing protein [Aetokthonos hydrillicola Thurmond2011]|jgi:hypothetical protein|uniref:CHAT domain-containing protein n=1 Tax=Aetokthonos hydrillicola Thurmond2011 TaxID=2712845 RepID=A0AAP5MD07_9CYAN|nr:CHAT domain-containing protein [Aetokthonos hydrillicola]MDR9899852.1 CHAT domain-containing protein [Aetokthonos hydrillicola Thurmond2011]